MSIYDRYTQQSGRVENKPKSDAPRAHPPDVNGRPLEYTKPFTRKERETARRLIAEAKRKAGLNVEVIEKRKPHEPIRRSMAQLLSDAKRCFSYYSQWDEQCPQEFKSWESNQNIKCYWCEKFEQQRNAETVNEGARHILEGKK